MIIVYFDTETGGTEPRHPTIQLAAVATDGDTEVSSFEQCIAFNEADCDPEALALNHYSADAWADAVSPAVCAARFAAWLRPFQSVELKSKRTGQPYTVARMAGYNVPFDQPRLRQLFGASFMPCEMLMRDVLQRVLLYFDWLHEFEPRPENYKLSTIAAHFGIPSDGAHGALADARMCARIDRELWRRTEVR